MKTIRKRKACRLSLTAPVNCFTWRDIEHYMRQRRRRMLNTRWAHCAPKGNTREAMKDRSVRMFLK